MDINILGNRIKSLRETSNINQQDFAKKLNIANTTLSQYESGKRIPSDSVKKQIAEYFNVSLDYLMGNSDIKNPYKGNIHPDVTEVESAMKIIMEQPGLMLNGELLTDEDKIILANAIQLGLRYAEDMRKKNKK